MSSGVLIGGNTGVNINIIHRVFAQSTDRRSASLTSNQRKHQTGYLGRKKNELRKYVGSVCPVVRSGDGGYQR